MRQDELSSVVLLERRTMEDSSSRRIMRPLDKNGQCQSIKNSGQHGFRRRIWSGPILASGDIREHKGDAKIGPGRRL